MKKINLGLIGASGKMGIAVRECLKKNSSFVPFLSLSSKECSDFLNHFSTLSEVPPKLISKVHVWIEFSSPENLDSTLAFLKKRNESFRLVSGTTGLSAAHFKKMKSMGKTNAIFWASNMSPGLWALRQGLKALSSISNFNFSIEETHHLQKKDNPSGTAITLQKDLESIIGRKIPTPVGHREADVFGEHTITARSDSEILNFEHIALNRTVFANGALRASEFLVKKKTGFYSMEDLGAAKTVKKIKG